MPACPGCGYRAEPGRDACPVCGRRLSGPGREPEPRSGDAAGSARPAAWEDPSAPFPRNLLQTWIESLLRPRELFRRVSLDASLVRPVLYLLLVSIAGAFLDLMVAATGLQAPVPEGLDALYGIGAGLDAGELHLIGFLVSPFSALLGLLFGTLIVHVCVRLLVSGARRMGATARVLCYATGPGVFGFLATFGGLPGLLASLLVTAWFFGLVAVGLREVHRTTTGRAVVIVLAPVFFVALLFVLLGFLLFLAGPDVPGLPLPGT